MGQFIHQDQRRLAGQSAVQIELLEYPVAIGNIPQRQIFQAIGHDFRFHPAMRLDNADDDIDTGQKLLPRRPEHGVGLADTG